MSVVLHINILEKYLRFLIAHILYLFFHNFVQYKPSPTSIMDCQFLGKSKVSQITSVLWRYTHLCFCCPQDEMWIKMPKGTIFEV